MDSILGAIVRNMQDRRRYLNGIPDRGWGFVAPCVAPVGATEHGIRPEVAEHPEAERGFVMLRQRPVVACDSAQVCRLRRLVGGVRSLVFSSSGHPVTGPSP